jgi:hypothetical protein
MGASTIRVVHACLSGPPSVVERTIDGVTATDFIEACYYTALALGFHQDGILDAMYGVYEERSMKEVDND